MMGLAAVVAAAAVVWWSWFGGGCVGKSSPGGDGGGGSRSWLLSDLPPLRRARPTSQPFPDETEAEEISSLGRLSGAQARPAKGRRNNAGGRAPPYRHPGEVERLEDAVRDDDTAHNADWPTGSGSRWRGRDGPIGVGMAETGVDAVGMSKRTDWKKQRAS